MDQDLRDGFWEALRDANREPLNVAAAQLLPRDWAAEAPQLNVLALALWGLLEGGVHLHGRQGRPDNQAAEDAIHRLSECDPQEALDWIQGCDGNEETFPDDALDECESAEAGAWAIVEQIALSLESERPLPPRFVRSVGDARGRIKELQADSAEMARSLKVCERFGLAGLLVASELAKTAATRIVRQTISWLRTLEATLSGDETVLRNVWEEICVQVQCEEESIFWDTYKEMVLTDFAARISQLEYHVQIALGLQTPAGFEWRFGNEPDESEDPPINDHDIAAYLWSQYFLPQAERYTNERIRRFLQDVRGG